jgi:hypothetical protein
MVTLEQFETAPLLQQRVRELSELYDTVLVFVFQGWAGGISTGSFPYLCLPGLEPFPLFQLPDVTGLLDSPPIGGVLSRISTDWEPDDMEEEEPEVDEPGPESDSEILALDELPDTSPGDSEDGEYYYDDDDRVE